MQDLSRDYAARWESCKPGNVTLCTHFYFYATVHIFDTCTAFKNRIENPKFWGRYAIRLCERSEAILFLLDAYGDRHVAALLAMTNLSRNFLKLMALRVKGRSHFCNQSEIWGCLEFSYVKKWLLRTH